MTCGEKKTRKTRLADDNLRAGFFAMIMAQQDKRREWQLWHGQIPSGRSSRTMA
nr:MAG TPA: hypothetical protein [Caudoviricetes sp.]